MEAQKDVVTLDVSNDPDLKEYFSRKETGDECTGKFKLQFDELDGDLVRLNITDVKFEMGKNKAATDDSPAAKVYKENTEAEAEAPADEPGKDE
jgi:hypothetical protein